MNSIRHSSTLLACAGLVAAASLAIVVSPARAQSGDDRSYDRQGDLSDVTVMAPRHFERDGATGAPIENVSASRVVQYGDLDLGDRQGMRELHARIQGAARSACGELDHRYPESWEKDAGCVRGATRNAMAQVETANNDYSRDWRR